MSTQTATQAQPAAQTAATEATTTATKAPVTATASTTPAKRQKITDRIVASLRGLEETQVMTVSELYAKMSDVGEKTLQATLSQLVKAGRVVKVKTGKRQPGYKAATSK